MDSIINIKDGQESNQRSSNSISNLSPKKLVNPDPRPQPSQRPPKPPRHQRSPRLKNPKLKPPKLMPQLPNLPPHLPRMPALPKRKKSQKPKHPRKPQQSQKPPKPKSQPREERPRPQLNPKLNPTKLNQLPRNDCECGFFNCNLFPLLTHLHSHLPVGCPLPSSHPPPASQHRHCLFT